MATESLTVSVAAGPHKSGSSSRVWFGSDKSNAKYYVTELSFTIPEGHVGSSIAIVTKGKNDYAGSSMSSGKEYYYSISTSDITSYDSIPSASTTIKTTSSIGNGSSATLPTATITQTFTPKQKYYVYIWGKNPSSVYSLLTHSSSAVTLTYSLQTYTVSYNANGGSSAPSSQTKTYGTDLTLTSSTPTRTGYTFAGWNTASDGSGTNYSAGGSYTSNAAVTLYAKWTVNSYAYTLGTGTGVSTTGSTASGSKNYGTTITLKATANTGYTWTRWTSSNTNLVANQTTANTTFSMPAGALTMTPSAAINTGTVYFYANGGTSVGDYTQDSSGKSSYSQTFDYSDTAKNLTNVTSLFSRTGYSITDAQKAWHDNKSTKTYFSQTSQDLSSYVASSTGVTLNLYANWTANTYTVTYDANGGTGSMAADSATYDSMFKTKQATFTRVGYTFTGWNEKADGTGTAWNKNTTGTYENGTAWKWSGTNYAKNITLYAQWSKNSYTVTVYDGFDDTSILETKTATYGDSVTLQTNFTNTQTVGYVPLIFGDAGTTAMPVYQIKQYGSTFTGSWVPNNATFEMPPQDVVLTLMCDDAYRVLQGRAPTEEAIRDLHPNPPSYSEYYLKGWGVDPKVVAITPHSVVKYNWDDESLTDEVYLHEIWKPITRSVFYYKQDGRYKLGTLFEKIDDKFIPVGGCQVKNNDQWYPLNTDS